MMEEVEEKRGGGVIGESGGEMGRGGMNKIEDV